MLVALLELLMFRSVALTMRCSLEWFILRNKNIKNMSKWAAHLFCGRHHLVSYPRSSQCPLTCLPLFWRGGRIWWWQPCDHAQPITPCRCPSGAIPVAKQPIMPFLWLSPWAGGMSTAQSAGDAPHSAAFRVRFHLHGAVAGRIRDGDRWRLPPAVVRFHYGGSSAGASRICRGSSSTENGILPL